MKLLATSLIGLVAVLVLRDIAAPNRQVAGSRAFWASFTYVGEDVESYDQLSSLTSAADAVVVGRMTSATAGRVFGTPSIEPGGQVFYASVTIEVGDVLAGALPLEEQKSLILELMLPASGTVDQLQEKLPLPAAIFFLRNKGKEAESNELAPSVQTAEAPFYRLTMSGAVLPSVGSEVEDIDRGGENEFLEELSGQPFDTVVAEITRFGSQEAIRP